MVARADNSTGLSRNKRNELGDGKIFRLHKYHFVNAAEKKWKADATARNNNSWDTFNFRFCHKFNLTSHSHSSHFEDAALLFHSFWWNHKWWYEMWDDSVIRLMRLWNFNDFRARFSLDANERENLGKKIRDSSWVVSKAFWKLSNDYFLPVVTCFIPWRSNTKVESLLHTRWEIKTLTSRKCCRKTM